MIKEHLSYYKNQDWTEIDPDFAKDMRLLFRPFAKSYQLFLVLEMRNKRASAIGPYSAKNDTDKNLTQLRPTR